MKDAPSVVRKSRNIFIDNAMIRRIVSVLILSVAMAVFFFFFSQDDRREHKMGRHRREQQLERSCELGRRRGSRLWRCCGL